MEISYKLKTLIEEWLNQSQDNYLINISSELYPPLLRNIANPPNYLFAKGNIKTLKDQTISIVGSRKPSCLLDKYLKTIVQKLATNNQVIVSGLAIGTDSLAHEYALKYSGKTIAVLPCGINIIYPQRNSQLAKKIVEQGLIISEFMPDVPARKHHFLQRNRIVTGLSKAIIIAQAEIHSGTMSSAFHALDQNREILVIPHGFDEQLSTGNFHLIQSGAYCLSSSEEALKLVLEINKDFPIG